MAAVKDLPLAERLVRGASVMGRLWREGKKCERIWAFDCNCDEAKKTDFCKAKAQWTKLYLEGGREIDFGGDFGIIEAMTSGELNASGLTLTLDVPEIGKVKVGPKGDLPWADFCRLGAEVLPTVMKVLKAFPGSKVI